MSLPRTALSRKGTSEKFNHEPQEDFEVLDVPYGLILVEVDTSPLERSYKNEHGGSSAYHPAMLLAILIYGYMNGIFSSRKIAKRLSQDLAFMYLAGNSRPDSRTLARFRKEKGTYLESI